MFAKHLPRENDPVTLLMGSRPAFRSLDRSHAQLESFNGLVKYLAGLRRNGTLDDHDFRELMKMVSAMFIEAEISNRVENVLEKALEKALGKALGNTSFELWGTG